LLQPADVAAAVLYAVNAPPHACVTELDLQPLRTGPA
jgi:NADP-dependent 3-hydroxy acid dehydrogenase YdfG